MRVHSNLVGSVPGKSQTNNSGSDKLFPTLDIVHQLGFADHIWLRYQDTRAKLLTIEHRLETEFFSPELMDMLRTTNALNKWDMTLNTAKYKRMYQRISAIEFSILRNCPCIEKQLLYIFARLSSIFPSFCSFSIFFLLCFSACSLHK